MKPIITLLLCLYSILASAIPAQNVRKKATLTDGTPIEVMLRGDETFHFLTTPDGTPVIEVEESVYRLAPESAATIGREWTRRHSKRNRQRLMRAAYPSADTPAYPSADNAQRYQFGHPSRYVGKKRGIVILVNFDNLYFAPENSVEAYRRQFNEVGYSDNGHIGSVHDYFHEASYGQFNLQFDVLGPVTLSKENSYYGRNDRTGMEPNLPQMIMEACRMADNNFDINWSDYDWDNDGEVDQVLLVYAGKGEHETNISYHIWPQEWSLSDAQEEGFASAPITLGGVTINTFAVSNEMNAQDNSMAGIGTACHEFSHCLGIPDWYDTSYNGGFGMNYWDVMAAGSYGGSTRYNVPAGYTAYERWFAGWLSYRELNATCTITNMPALDDKPHAYIIYNDANRNEFFILENHQNKGFHTYVSNYDDVHGLLVYHVDYDLTAWEEDTPNNDAAHQRMTIVPAGNVYGTYSPVWGQYSVTHDDYLSQPFPGSMSVTTLSKHSHPNTGGRFFNLNAQGTYDLNFTISGISESNGTISFSFDNGKEGSSPDDDTTLKGDVNNDGRVDISDINAIISVICGQ